MFALLILALSIPVYYVIVDYIWVNELDKHHQSVKLKVEKEINELQISDSTLDQTLFIWNRINPGSSFTPIQPSEIRKDSTYSILRFDDFRQDREQFRCLVTYVNINNKPYRLLVETNMEETDETIMAIAGVTIIFFLILFIGFVILNRRLSQKIWKPFYNTLNSLKSFNLEGEKKLSFEKSDIQEFQELNEGLGKLIEKNILVFSQQKEFTENASHELQTPLAIIQSQLDMLLQSEELTIAQFETVEGINRTLARAYRINKNLLLLAKIENSRLFLDTEKVNLSELVNESLEILLEHIDSKEIDIEKNITVDIYVQGNKSLLEVMVNNLLLNAIRHNPMGGNLSVSLSPGAFIVSNSGNQALDTVNLFKRFISASKETPGSGLGLAIVKQISQRLGWKIDYYFENHRHIFSVRF
jgi:signal transduction histidine kinase